VDKIKKMEDKQMNTIILSSDELNLPKEIASKLKGKKIEAMEVKEGILLRPISDPIKEARGFLKSKRFSTQRYLQMKKEEKEIEA